MGFFDRIYPFVPAWAQNVGISLYGLAYRNERLGGRYEQWVAEFEQRDRWSASQMRAYVAASLRRVLAHAFREVPYYRQAWTSLGLHLDDLMNFRPEDLPSLPTTPKEPLRRNPMDFVARNIAARQKLHPYYTSGSTGTPITCYFTADGHRSFIAAREVRSFRWAGSSIRSPRSMMGGRLIVPDAEAMPPYYRYNWAERQVY
ncbi:MAG: hypothetical protein JO336_24940, partial [Acidobacteriia bacterium]|nr:hypothetical protein [Terriglobia bacterium]